MSQSVLFIMMSLPEDAPYISYYEYYFKQLGVKLDYIIWDRSGTGNKYPENYFVFRKKSPQNKSALLKFYDMLLFGRFVTKVLYSRNYYKIVVFTIQAALFVSKLLLRQKCKYIIDIRDYSPLLKFSYFKRKLEIIVKHSFAVFVSSPKFTEFLPTGCYYHLSHNIHPDIIGNITDSDICFSAPYKILTIGQIRDVESNSEIIESLGSNENYVLQFSGKGHAVKALKKIVDAHGYKRVAFTGPYQKKDEQNLTQNCDLINAFMPNNYNSSLLLSNRLYLSVINGKPIIVNKNSLQGEIVREYNLGLAIDDCSNLENEVDYYINTFNNSVYINGRLRFIKKIEEDLNSFALILKSFVKS